ncbi:MAG: hypothetical protein SF069_09230 [Phycisphaerae bacterium]|nr:hypothetical protein [Phycisphaerae bacterium]
MALQALQPLRASANGVVAHVEIKHGFYKIHTWLVVVDGGRAYRAHLDSHMTMGRGQLVQYGEWILLLNDGWAIGGYNCQSKRIFGDREWHQLPFRKWTGQGALIATKTYDTKPAILPAGYVCVPDDQPK